MLIQKPLTPGDIVSIKLTNGDEVVGTLVTQDPGFAVLAKPVIVAIQPVGQQQVQLGFMPFMVSTGDEAHVNLPVASMLSKPAKTRTDVANNYRRATSSIEPASGASGLIGL